MLLEREEGKKTRFRVGRAVTRLCSCEDHERFDERRVFRVQDTRDQDADDELWSVTFKRSDVDGDLIPTYWAWTLGEQWTAAENARFEFSGFDYLYKLRVSCVLPPELAWKGTDSCQAFLADFIPVAAPYLMPPETR